MYIIIIIIIVIIIIIIIIIRSWLYCITPELNLQMEVL